MRGSGRRIWDIWGRPRVGAVPTGCFEEEECVFGEYTCPINRFFDWLFSGVSNYFIFSVLEKKKSILEKV